MNYNYYDQDTTIPENTDTNRIRQIRIRFHPTIRQNPGYYYRTATIVGTSSFCVVLPKQYANNLGVGKGDFLKVSQEEDKIVIRKA